MGNCDGGLLILNGILAVIFVSFISGVPRNLYYKLCILLQVRTMGKKSKQFRTIQNSGLYIQKSI